MLVLAPTGEARAAVDQETAPELTAPTPSDLSKINVGIVVSWNAANLGSKYLGSQQFVVTAYERTKILLMQVPGTEEMLVVRLPNKVNGESFYLKIAWYMASQATKEPLPEP